jgi:ribose 5-phosphate isomerase A
MKQQDALKKQVADAAIKYIKSDMILGIGTGSTVNYLIEALSPLKNQLENIVSSSEDSTKRLKNIGIYPVDLNYVGSIDLYIDGADEANAQKQLIKGGGGALTREKILAANSKEFICIMDESKQVDILGAFPLPVEVIPMARGFVAREIVKLGGQPVYREDFITDNGNIILDVHNLKIMEATKLEAQLNNITGVVTNGIFAQRPADKLLVASSAGLKTY